MRDIRGEFSAGKFTSVGEYWKIDESIYANTILEIMQEFAHTHTHAVLELNWHVATNALHSRFIIIIY